MRLDRIVMKKGSNFECSDKMHRFVLFILSYFFLFLFNILIFLNTIIFLFLLFVLFIDFCNRFATEPVEPNSYLFTSDHYGLYVDVTTTNKSKY